MKPKLVVLLGAGLSESAKMPTTADLTRCAATTPEPTIYFNEHYSGEMAPFAHVLHTALSGYFDKPDFETMLHAVEALAANRYSIPGLPVPDAFKPVTRAFMDPMPRWRCLTEYDRLAEAGSKMLYRIAVYLAGRQGELIEAAKDQIAELLQPFAASYQLVIGNLNYDNIVDAALPDAADGFGAPSVEGTLFSYDTLLGADGGLVHLNLHLHGSLLYGLAEDWAIRKYPSTADSSKQWGRVFQDYAQSGDVMFLAPIISGLRKAEKTLVPPFGQYNHMFVSALLQCPRLLIIGYSGRDSYLANWLREWKRWHNTRARLVVITKESLEGDDQLDGALALPASMMTYTTKSQLRSGRDERRPMIVKQGQAFLVTDGVPLTAIEHTELLEFLG